MEWKPQVLNEDNWVVIVITGLPYKRWLGFFIGRREDMEIIRSKFFMCLICFILGICMINVCLAGDYSNQPYPQYGQPYPQYGGYGKFFEGPSPGNWGQAYYKERADQREQRQLELEAERHRKEMQRLELQNQRLQQEIQERELQRQKRIFEERRQQRLLEERRQAKMKKQTEQGKDIYAELIKLDELKQKGIITEEEFEAQKKKILSGNNTYAGMGKSNTQKSCEAQCAEKFNNGELVKGARVIDCINVLCGN